MGFFSRLFRKKEVRKEVVSITGLSAWYDEVSKERVNQIKSKITNDFNDIRRGIYNINDKLARFQNAALKNTNIPQRAIQIMEGNREQYISSVNVLLMNLHLPKEITYSNITEFLSRYEDLLDSFTRASQRSFYVLQEFFAKETKEIAEDIKTVRNVMDEDYRRIVEIKKDVGSLAEKARLRRLAKEAIEDEKMKLKRFTEEKEMTQDSIDNIRRSESYLELKSMQEKKKETLKECDRKEVEINSMFSPLQRALKKFARVTISDEKLVESYMDSPLKALLSDKEYRIVWILSNMKSSAMSGALDLKDDELEKTIDIINSITEQKLKIILNEYEDLKGTVEAVEKRISLNNTMHRIHELEYKHAHAAEKKEIVEKNIEKLEKIINNDDIQKLSSYIKERIKDAFDMELEMIDTPDHKPRADIEIE